jgi:F-type H+-transporting ATPase subunit gamma
VLGALLPHSLNFQMHQILLEAKASEHSARMVAMKNATDNAQQLIKDLTLEYNKLRQANITKELAGNHQRRNGGGLTQDFYE